MHGGRGVASGDLTHSVLATPARRALVRPRFMPRLFAVLCPLMLAVHAFADAPAEFEVGAFKFTRPADWKWVEVPEGMKMMRKAVLEAPGAEGAKPAEVIFYHFGAGQGGDPQANVARWIAQFSDKTAPEKSETKEFSGTKMTLVRVAGTYQSGMPMGPKTPMPGYALLGAIVEDAATGHVFIKMTGPQAVVEGAAKNFEALLASAKR